MNYIFWILFSAVFGVSYLIGFKIKRYWTLLAAPFLGIFAAGVNVWVYFAFVHLEKTGLGILGVLVVAPVFIVIIGALDIVVSLVGAFLGVYMGRRK